MARICLVTHYMPPHRGGVERVAQQLSHWYSRAGHDVTWLATDAPVSAGPDRDGEIRLERVAASNILEHRFGMPFPVPSIEGLRRIARSVRMADVVHLHDCLYVPILAADRAARRAGVPTLVTQHVGMVSFGGPVDPLLFGAYRTVGRAVLRHAAQVAFVNQGVRSWFRERIDPDLASEHIPNGVDITAFRVRTPAERATARASLGVPGSEPVVLFAGRLVAKKNLASAIRALREIGGPWHVLVVGDGPERTALAGLGGRCTQVPDLAHARMPDAYAAADLFVLPSRDEGTPLTVLEALASGLPVVTSDDRAFAELTSCRGVVQVSAAPGALASALAALLTDPARRTAMGAASRAWAEASYSEDKIAARYLAMVSEITAGSRAPGASRG